MIKRSVKPIWAYERTERGGTFNQRAGLGPFRFADPSFVVPTSPQELRLRTLKALLWRMEVRIKEGVKEI